MIEKWYEVSCDNCGYVINHYAGNKPSKQELQEDGAFIKGNLVFCNKDCYKEYLNKQNS